MPDSPLSDIINVATTMEMAKEDNEKLSLSFDSSICSARSKPSIDRDKFLKCAWCGKNKHERQLCPARASTCSKCNKKGHWSTVCFSSESRTNKLAIVSESKSDHESNEDPNSMCGILAAANQISRLHDVQINQQVTKALIDTGADLSFISKNLINDFKLNYQSHGSKLITLADKSTSKVVGKFTGILKLDSETLEHTFYILDTLIVPVIIGMDILSQFSLVTIRTEGQLRPLNLLMPMSSMNCESYRLLPGRNTDELKPIATPSLRFIRDKEFIYSEIQRLKREDIIQDSQSPWRAQCFVINQNEKKRLVVDYSNTINLQTFIDAYPMPRIDDIVAEVSQNKWFSKIDLK